MFSVTCNLNCICLDADCKYNHLLAYKERKIVNQHYLTLTNVNKEESSPLTRKKNCNFGQLCNNESCGFKHRLCYENREKLIILYNYDKICPNKTTSFQIEISKKEKKKDNISSKNLFLTLDDLPEEEFKEVKSKPLKALKPIKDVEPFVPPIYLGKSWIDVINQGKKPKPIDLSLKISNWEDTADDSEFYMKF